MYVAYSTGRIGALETYNRTSGKLVEIPENALALAPIPYDAVR